MKLVSAFATDFPNATVCVSQSRHKLNTPLYVYGHCRQFPEGKWQITYRNSRTLRIKMTRIYSSMKGIFRFRVSLFVSIGFERNRRLSGSYQLQAKSTHDS